MFKELKSFGEKHIILDYGIEHIVHILEQADEVHFMGDYQSFVITNLVGGWRNDYHISGTFFIITTSALNRFRMLTR
jgi:hypothetical protein